jgi:AraC family transcriptional regulator
MQWNELFPKDAPPSENAIREYVGTPLWDDLLRHLRQTYNVRPVLSYSGCSMDKGFWKGWNVKFKKSGKALCSLYPKKGYFVALIAVSAKDKAKADQLILHCDAYTQQLYEEREFGRLGKSLPLEVARKSILRDVENLITLRVL